MRFLTSALLFITASINLFSQNVEKAPEIEGITAWINSDALALKNLKGKVVLLDFWDYSCINCIRTLPYLNSWYNQYKDKGFVIIGIHTPEFSFEHKVENVQKAVKRFNILYPVALDNDYKTWKAYNNKYWPTSYLIDKEGNITLIHIGEGKYLELENAIRQLLNLSLLTEEKNTQTRPLTTPEIYLGFRRAQNYTPEIDLVPNTIHLYEYNEPLSEDRVGLKGKWVVSAESITSANSNSSIILNFSGSKVHIVLAGTSSEPVTVLLDGKPLEKQNYTTDMDAKGNIYINEDRKYDLVDLQKDTARHQLTITVPSGISAYSFTFGSTHN